MWWNVSRVPYLPQSLGKPIAAPAVHSVPDFPDEWSVVLPLNLGLLGRLTVRKSRKYINERRIESFRFAGTFLKTL